MECKFVGEIACTHEGLVGSSANLLVHRKQRMVKYCVGVCSQFVMEPGYELHGIYDIHLELVCYNFCICE